MPEPRFFVAGALVAAVLAGLGLVASFFHLGHPERAWRAAAKWRTSWLSREVIALPAFIGGVMAYGAAHAFGWTTSPWLGFLTLVACIALFVCTGMVYACIRFLQEWASPLTLVNFFLLGTASGCTLATALAAWLAPALVTPCAKAAIALTIAALVGRVASLVRNARCGPSPRCRRRSASSTRASCRKRRASWAARSTRASSFTARRKKSCARSSGASWC